MNCPIMDFVYGTFAVLLIISVFSPTRLETAAANPIVLTKGVCVSQGSLFQLTWEARRARPAQNLLVACEGLDGERRDIESLTRYSVEKTHCIEGCQYCDLVTKLTVHNVTADDAGNCYGYLENEGPDVVSNNSRARIWVREDTVLTISEENVNMTLGQDFEVGFQLECDFGGSFDIAKIDEGRTLQHRYQPGPDLSPYLKLRGGQLPVIHFVKPACRDEGLYRITYHASRNYQHVMTTLDLKIHALGTRCPKRVPTTVTSKQPLPTDPSRQDQVTTSSSSSDQSWSNTVLGFLVFFAASSAVLLLLCIFLFYQKRQLRRNLNTRDISAMEKLNGSPPVDTN